ncbi:hypothetical protein CGA21_22605 [Pseudomonas sp. PSB11]|nr:hypothetical protein [Pseudomonas sp. PSB11]
MWERACSRMQSVSQRLSRLTHRLREQARSHRVGREEGRFWRPFFMDAVWAILGLSRAAVRAGCRAGNPR